MVLHKKITGPKPTKLMINAANEDSSSNSSDAF